MRIEAGVPKRKGNKKDENKRNEKLKESKWES